MRLLGNSFTVIKGVGKGPFSQDLNEIQAMWYLEY